MTRENDESAANVRRRPLLRAALVGGGAYLAGKRIAQQRAEQSYTEANQAAGIETVATTAGNVYRQARDRAASRAEYDLQGGLERLTRWMLQDEPDGMPGSGMSPRL